MKKIKEINYIFYMVLIYSFSCLYGIFYSDKITDMLKLEKINFGYVGIFIILLISYLFLFVKHNKTMEGVIKFITKVLTGMSVILMGVNYPKQWLLGLAIYMVIIYIALFIPREKVKELNNTKLYPSRRNLMEVLNHALEEYSLIALDGTWGSGKTTFMNIFMRDKREKYYYIPINVMLFENRNSLKTEFLNQLKGIFKEEGIFQGSLMDFDYYLDGVSNDWVKIVKNIIFSKSKSFKEANEKLKSEIGKIEKRIVVGVDNLERIYGESEPEWKQILGFIHELQELGIKIVVMANLEEMLTTKKETGEKDLSNHEYFDKFYEFKLKLNEVTTEEIIDGVEDIIQEEKNWMKKQFEELIQDISPKFKELKDKKSELNRAILSYKENEETRIQYKDKIKINEEKIKEINNEMLEFERYYENKINPRKIEKLIKDIQTKQKNRDNIFNFIDDDEYEKLIFKASIFFIFYFDYMNEIKEKDFGDFYRGNSFFEYYFTNIGEAFRGLNRLLHHDNKENLVIERIKKLISTKEINLSTIDERLKDLEIYSNSLDPDFEQNTTKEAYKVIELKLVELEKTDKKKIHKVIKENEENISRLNYLTYPNDFGIYGEVGYKFEIESKYQKKGILNIYYNLLNKLDDVINQSRFDMDRKNSLRELIGFRNTIVIFSELTKQPKLSSEEISGLYEKHSEIFTINDIEKLKNTIESRVKSDYIKEELENKIFERLLNLLNILEVNLTRPNVIIRSNKILEELEKYGEKKDGNEKIKFLDEILWRIREEKEVLNSKEMQEINDLLNKIMESESNFELLFKLNESKNDCEIRIFPKQIKERSEEILNIKQNNQKEKFERTKKELIDFINEKVKEVRWQYIFNGAWDKDLEKLIEIGVEIDREKCLVKEEPFIKF